MNFEKSLAWAPKDSDLAIAAVFLTASEKPVDPVIWKVALEARVEWLAKREPLRARKLLQDFLPQNPELLRVPLYELGELLLRLGPIADVVSAQWLDGASQPPAVENPAARSAIASESLESWLMRVLPLPERT